MKSISGYGWIATFVSNQGFPFNFPEAFPRFLQLLEHEG